MSTSGTLRNRLRGSVGIGIGNAEVDLALRRPSDHVKKPLKTAIPEDTDGSEDSSTECLEDQPSSSLESSDTESGTDTDQEQAAGNTEKALSTLSFEELIHIQNKVGKKRLSKTVRVFRGEKHAVERVRPTNKQPLEMSSKKPIPFLRKVVPAKTMMRRDPRFDDLSGKYKAEVFEKTYSFLNDIKKKERQVVEKKLQKTRDPELKEKLEQLLGRMDQQDQATQKKCAQRERAQDFKRQQRELAQQGKKPFYLKKGDVRKMELADKYKELKRKGKLEHFLSKKRKRNSNKDRRRLPNK